MKRRGGIDGRGGGGLYLLFLGNEFQGSSTLGDVAFRAASDKHKLNLNAGKRTNRHHLLNEQNDKKKKKKRISTQQVASLSPTAY